MNALTNCQKHFMMAEASAPKYPTFSTADTLI